MRKSTLFISGTLTAFLLAILYGVISSYQVSGEQASAATQAAVIENTAAAFEVSTPATFITPEQAAALAAQILGRTDLYSVASALMADGLSAYKVTFSSGDVVYVGLDGSILSVVMLTPSPVVVVDSSSAGNSNKNNNTRPPIFGGGDDNGGGDD